MVVLSYSTQIAAVCFKWKQNKLQCDSKTNQLYHSHERTAVP